MAKHDLGNKRRRGYLQGLVLSRELGYDIDDVMGETIFSTDEQPMSEKSYDVTADDLQEMRRKIGEHF